MDTYYPVQIIELGITNDINELCKMVQIFESWIVNDINTLSFLVQIFELLCVIAILPNVVTKLLFPINSHSYNFISGFIDFWHGMCNDKAQHGNFANITPYMEDTI